MLIPIRIDVDVAGIRIIDSVLWDPYNIHLTPESFAALFCADENLPNELIPIIAIDIRRVR